MLTGGMGYSYNVQSTLPLTQTNVDGYPTTPTALPIGASGSGYPLAGHPNKTGGLIVIAPNMQVVATGYTGRRAIVDDTKCNACHQELGAFTEEAFHGGQRNDGSDLFVVPYAEPYQQRLVGRFHALRACHPCLREAGHG